MEPASIVAITGGCIAITRNAISFVRAVCNWHAGFSDADVQIRALVANTDLLGIVAERLRQRFHQNEDNLPDHELNIVLNSIRACERLVHALNRRAEETVRNPPKGDNATEESMGFRQRLRFLWNQQTLDIYTDAIVRQVEVLNLYISALNG